MIPTIPEREQKEQENELSCEALMEISILLGENPMNFTGENRGMPKNSPVYNKCHMDNRFVQQKMFELYFSKMATVD